MKTRRVCERRAWRPLLFAILLGCGCLLAGPVQMVATAEPPQDTAKNDLSRPAETKLSPAERIKKLDELGQAPAAGGSALCRGKVRQGGTRRSQGARSLQIAVRREQPSICGRPELPGPSVSRSMRLFARRTAAAPGLADPRESPGQRPRRLCAKPEQPGPPGPGPR